ncbi:ATP-binding protein [Puia dinghuensis]|uniref:Sensory/regulatory protein RpfC n=1 Tax=Puia dinghuensis TaxID=1792502 RepID=A0A8J2U844_9BACT|nr:ATP-binding protein [Puia dinghuensis]GGA85862.1 hypothetical protein GCM10011511_06150 [Puia dinghuensis]
MISAFNGRIVFIRKIAWLLFFSLFSLCLIGFLLYFNKKKIDHTADWVGHTYSVIDRISHIRQRLTTWESLSCPPLSPAYRHAMTSDVDQLKTLTGDNAVQQKSVILLSSALDRLNAGADSISVAGVTAALDTMMDEEKGLLVQRQAESHSATRKSNLLFICGILLAFLFIDIMLIRLNKDMLLRRQAERKLKENQVWLESILENTNSVIFIKDLEGRYVIVNRRFAEVVNKETKNIIGRKATDIVSPAEAEHSKAVDEQVLRAGKALEMEEVFPGPGGNIHLLNVKFPLLDANGRLIGIGGIAADITDRVHYQQQLIAATREALNAKGMQEMFLANMSHEIRTPMNGIQGMTDLLLDTQLNDQQKEFARTIKRSVNNLLVVVNDVLDFSKIKAGKLAIEKIEFRLKDVLDNVKAMFAHRVAKKGLELEVEIDPSTPEVLKGDPYRLNQVLVNLIGNALKFTEKGWIRVEVNALKRTADQVNLRFTIADSGIGIPEASLPHIFEHFSQAGLDISRRYGGTGLGLAICQQLLQLQGGDIEVKSREKEGTTFQFRLSYGYNNATMDSASGTAVLADYSHCLVGKRILVAEDNEVNRQLIDHVLRKGGGQVQLVSNGEEALTVLKQGETYDLIIMDLQMPVMDGYEATRVIRHELLLSTPIIAMTATALVGEQLRCFESGMNDYMTKPFEFAELYKRITALLTPFISIAG